MYSVTAGDFPEALISGCDRRPRPGSKRNMTLGRPHSPPNVIGSSGVAMGAMAGWALAGWARVLAAPEAAGAPEAVVWAALAGCCRGYRYQSGTDSRSHNHRTRIRQRWCLHRPLSAPSRQPGRTPLKHAICLYALSFPLVGQFKRLKNRIKLVNIGRTCAVFVQHNPDHHTVARHVDQHQCEINMASVPCA